MSSESRWTLTLVWLAIFAAAELMSLAPDPSPCLVEIEGYRRSGEQQAHNGCAPLHVVAMWLVDEFGGWFGRQNAAITATVNAIATVVIAAFTIILGVFTVRLAESTRIAADAAKESAEVSQRALVITQRAFVRVASYPWLWRPDTDRPGKFWYDITPIVENFGNTPTIGAKINTNYALRDTILPDDFDFPYWGEAGDALVGPKQTVGASHAVILDDDLLKVQKGEKFFYIWGVITYRDGFESTPIRTTEFCTQISRVMGNPLDPREPGAPKGTSVEISFRVYPKHQRTD